MNQNTTAPKPALDLLFSAMDNHTWRQEKCINLIPSENTPSKAVQLLCASDPAFRYAEHKKQKGTRQEVFYYQGVKFIGRVEELLVNQMRQYMGCTEVETRLLSGQMSNTVAFSALMSYKNRFHTSADPQRLGYVLNNHLIKGGHLSAQPMGALHDYIARDPVTGKYRVINFPVCPDNLYKIDVAATKELIARYTPELIVFGKSMVLYREPVREIADFVKAQGIPTTIMYDMAHVLGLVGDYFQNPFVEGAHIVTGSTHKTFFGPQRGIVATNWTEEQEEYGIWKAVEKRTFPGSVSNHHLGTQLGLLMAAYEMNTFKDAYQSALIHNAKHFAKALKNNGLDVKGDPAIDFTETHQVLLGVGSGRGPEMAERLEKNNIIVNYQATPDEEGFAVAGALRMGLGEMTRFGFDDEALDRLAELMAACILHDANIKDEVVALRARHLTMGYCFSDAAFDSALGQLSKLIEA